MLDREEWRNAATDDLIDTLLTLRDREEAERFLRDLCTLREIHDLAQRWQVVRMLDAGRHYGEISRATGASTATVTRIAQWLRYGTGGYRLALSRSPRRVGPDRPVDPATPAERTGTADVGQGVRAAAGSEG
jgi:TrpR-related protein YerC/YecD